MHRSTGVVAALLVAAGALGLGAPAAADPFGGCAAAPAPGDAVTVAVGTVACQKIDASETLGGVTAFSYYVPPGCDPAGGRTCPTLYLLHGFGGDHTSELGTAASPSAKVAALTAGPPGDPAAEPDPWEWADPGTWAPRDALDLILVAPHGRTLDGGFGPAPDLDSFWGDWNPRYAAGGDQEAYATPPPRFETFLLEELVPFVEGHLPAGGGREWRALDGVSLGGYGSFRLGLRHPDVWSSIGAISGAHNFLFAPGPDPVDAGAPAGTAPPAAIAYAPLPGAAPRAPWLDLLPGQAQGFAVAFFALGDPGADQAYYRGNMPRDLAMNGRATHGGAPSTHIRFFVNDAVPRRAEDFGPSYPVAQGFEAIVLPMNLEMDAAFGAQGVERSFEVHPGLHSGAYWNPFLRAQLEAHWAHLEHPDGSGGAPPRPDRFDYRTIERRFRVWGWRFEVERDALEFLTLAGVSCDGLRLRGTGRVRVTVPGWCRTGLEGAREFTVDLGPSHPFDEPAGAGAAPVYGTTVDVALTPR